LQNLKEVRQDFVANVARELKTPITSIKEFVKTLLDGAMESPDDTRRFLTIINKQADRRNSIVEDFYSIKTGEEYKRKNRACIPKGEGEQGFAING
jgi:two-component system phosphate regulon sensor histidine kinase PhoR